MEIMAAPAMAPKNRMTRIWGRLFDSAHGMMSIVKMATAIRYTGRRPYISLRGARSSDPSARPHRYVVMPRIINVLDLTPNVCIMPGMPLVY